MAFGKEVSVKGDPAVYQLSPEIKKYTLLDLGFTTKTNGTFIFERSLDPTSPFNQGIKLKIMIKGDFSGFKISTVTANGMQNVSIFSREQDAPLVEQYNFLIAELIKRSVIMKK
ncbi:cysteine desulfurase [Pediococcus stilesii]|uniref:Cysteine desulfurase n=1 Tax=Pediococcus stilesii TaxID=331679 RepID=A0A5R9BY78_9LACO|nr:DUF1831 domain-containing protein [Pediococcus stilesii]TLQ04990.1 cysteine desulfurase [Pediococcus stilesii]